MAPAAGQGPASTPTERYEALRQQALATPDARAGDLGLAVLVHRGVAAWLEAMATPHDGLPGCGTAPRGGGSMTERGVLVTYLAQMILARGRSTA